MATKYQPLVDHIATRAEEMVPLSFDEIAAILGSALPETMQIDAWQWHSDGHALVWRLHALGWSARLDRRNRRVIFMHIEE